MAMIMAISAFSITIIMIGLLFVAVALPWKQWKKLLGIVGGIILAAGCWMSWYALFASLPSMSIISMGLMSLGLFIGLGIPTCISKWRQRKQHVSADQ